VLSLTDALKRAREHGLRIVACTEKGDTPLHEADLSGPLIVIMGSEESGISPSILRLSDQLVRIDMAGTIGSLNVSVATGIVLNQVLVSRRKPS
jgi:23S rRNA (guanosine2251-2'-O)-methyltransferase